jgi:hypothetical protein
MMGEKFPDEHKILDGVIRVPNTFTRHELEAVFGE